MEKNYIVTPSPHIRTKDSVESIMRDVIIALIPVLITAIYFFKYRAAVIIIVSVISALLSEALVQKMRKEKTTIFDGSAIITGLLFAFVVSPKLLWWQAAIGASLSILIGKMVFGGLGCNMFNPALVGRAILMASWPVAMTSWIIPNGTIDGIVGATPLGILKISGYEKLIEFFGSNRKMYSGLFFGNVGGCIGETSALAILLGAGYLFYKKIISWHIPLTYIGTVFIVTYLLGQDPLMHILAGGLFLGAFFMATDMVTTPYTGLGKIIFGIGAGLLVVWIRMKGGYPEGVCYSILIMNGVTPLINKFTKPKVFGEVKANG